MPILIRKTPFLNIALMTPLSIVIFFSSMSCKRSTTSDSDSLLSSDFIAFYDRFSTDSLFQINHIVFPLERTNNIGQLTTDDQWTRDNWELHQSYDPNNTEFSRRFKVLDSGIIEEYFQHPTTGFSALRRFAQIGNEWQLIYYTGIVEPN